MVVVLVMGQSSRAAAAAQAAGPSRIERPADDPDRLYAEREDVTKALAAATVWERRLAANAGDYESAWKLARACYWLGGHVAPDQRRAQLDKGIEAARRAVAAEPQQPGGTFLAGGDHGRHGRDRRDAGRPAVPRRDQARVGEGARPRPLVPEGVGRSRARPVVLQGARTLRRRRSEVARTPAAVADLRPRQRRVLVVHGRHPARAGQARGGAGRRSRRCCRRRSTDPSGPPRRAIFSARRPRRSSACGSAETLPRSPERPHAVMCDLVGRWNTFGVPGVVRGPVACPWALG